MTGMSAHARYIRQSPRKVRLVANLIRGLTVSSAFAQLAQVTKAAAGPVEKTLRSAVANAENNFQKRRDALFVKEIRIDEGPDYRRWRPRAFGRAAPILKHSCHISIVLDERAGADASQSVPAVSHDAVSFDDVQSSAVAALPPPLPAQEVFDKTRKGYHEMAPIVNSKEQKKSKGFIKNIIQRKTG